MRRIPSSVTPAWGQLIGVGSLIDRLAASLLMLALATLTGLIPGAGRLVSEIAGQEACHSVRQARERRKRLELGNLSSRPCG
jgi:hypothetical protein